MSPWVLNASGWAPQPAGVVLPPGESWPPAPSNIHWHDAVDPNLSFDRAANRWRISPSANDFPLWTESNWDSNVGFRTYTVEDPKAQIAVFVTGLGVALLAVVAVQMGKRYCETRFKKL